MIGAVAGRAQGSGPLGSRRGRALRLGAASAMATAVASLATASPGMAAVTLGPTDTAAPPSGLTGCGASDCTFANRAGPGLTIAAPFDGVLVRWRIQTATATATWRLRVVRQVSSGPALFTAAGTGAAETVMPGAERTFSTRLPISAGDLIGVDGPPSATAPLAYRSLAGGTFGRWNPPLIDGESPGRATTGSGGGFVGLYNADLEPDADGDGFGDETQDECPTDASTQAECMPPETTITRAPKDKLKAKKKTKKATFEFTSSEPGSSFECSLDGGAFAPCASPDTIKVKKGKHTFAVRATDQAGNVDASPASDDWKVKRKRKRK